MVKGFRGVVQDLGVKELASACGIWLELPFTQNL